MSGPPFAEAGEVAMLGQRDSPGGGPLAVEKNCAC